ncbi:MAG: ribulose-phosphate 3-epimerase [SAR324 cluster bacterium]|nr:ribulose-phosphate 3-epimerase [SAR324 cluster bacterium]
MKRDSVSKQEDIPVADSIQITPSLICMDFCNLEQNIRRLEAEGLELLHIDLLDAHFSSSMPLGLEIVRQLRDKTDLHFDVHLMVDNNEFFIREMVKIGVQQVCIHCESAFHIDRMLDLIQENGIKAGIALNPATSFSSLDYVLERLDFVLLMLINPGFAGHKGEKQVHYALKKIADCHKLLKGRNLDIPIEVDGRISFDSISQIVGAGADILVAGSSSLFHKKKPISKNLKKMRELIALGLEMRKVQVY